MFVRSILSSHVTSHKRHLSEHCTTFNWNLTHWLTLTNFEFRSTSLHCVFRHATYREGSRIFAGDFCLSRQPTSSSNVPKRYLDVSMGREAIRPDDSTAIRSRDNTCISTTWNVVTVRNFDNAPHKFDSVGLCTSAVHSQKWSTEGRAFDTKWGHWIFQLT
jgi:hypothetical protein